MTGPEKQAPCHNEKQGQEIEKHRDHCFLSQRLPIGSEPDERVTVFGQGAPMDPAYANRTPPVGPDRDTFCRSRPGILVRKRRSVTIWPLSGSFPGSSRKVAALETDRRRGRGQSTRRQFQCSLRSRPPAPGRTSRENPPHQTIRPKVTSRGNRSIVGRWWRLSRLQITVRLIILRIHFV
jgi:hypothetical protein